MDRSFPQSRAHRLVASALGGKATLDFPVWKARSVAPCVCPDAVLRQALSYELLW